MSNISSPLFRGTEVSVPGGTQVLTTTSTIAPTSKIISISSASAITLTSSPAIAPGQPGQEISLFNAGSFTITIPNNGVTFLGGATLTLPAGGVASFVYLNNSWRQVSQRQMPTCKVFNSTNVTCQSATFTTIPFDSVSYDSHKFRGTNNTQLVCQVEGVYNFVAWLVFDLTSSIGYRGGYLYKNSAIFASSVVPANSGGVQTAVLVPGSDYFKVGDIITVAARQSSGMAMDVVVFPGSPSLAMTYGGQSV